MMPADLTGWLIEIGSFVYFACKDLFLSKIFPGRSIRAHPIYSLVMALIGLYIGGALHRSYQEYLSMTMVKGSLHLPPFMLMFLLADFITSVGFVLIAYARAGT